MSIVPVLARADLSLEASFFNLTVIRASVRANSGLISGRDVLQSPLFFIQGDVL
jgi:hypothetical protein